MRPIRTDFALSLCESEECVVTSSRAKSTEANQNSQLTSLIELRDLERGGGVINDPPPTPVLSEGSEQSAKSSFDEIGKIWLHIHSRMCMYGHILRILVFFYEITICAEF